MKHVARHFPDVEVLSREDFDLTWERRAYGTITTGLGLADFIREDVPNLELRRPSRVVDLRLLGPGPPWSRGKIHVARTDLEDQPAIMFIRDSFATPVARFLRESVHETVMVHHKRGGFPKSKIEEYQPDLVIYEMVERGLVWELR